MTNLPSDGELFLPRAHRLQEVTFFETINPHSSRPKATEWGTTGSVGPDSAHVGCFGDAPQFRSRKGLPMSVPRVL